MSISQSIAGFAVFGLHGFWTQRWLSCELLKSGLGVSLIISIFYVIARIWLVLCFKPVALISGSGSGDSLASPGVFAAVLPACSVVLPFLFLVMATMRLPLFFFNDTATTEIYTLSLHDALPI